MESVLGRCNRIGTVEEEEAEAEKDKEERMKEEAEERAVEAEAEKAAKEENIHNEQTTRLATAKQVTEGETVAQFDEKANRELGIILQETTQRF
ncbi:hypothetical protein DPMN_145575 [Dreissena polymorpha]|uniref:Uncharacterized protein n=2 Tax=Dreissena polymorpha TaxID=45954 RepID=A0A9D4F4B0_DREPO|nr:hypothetical protein DPMN_145575 [Dreissena polymorpha]